MKQIVILGIVVLALGAKWWEPRCPPCTEPVVCRGEPCFMGQRCHEVRGCLPRVVSEQSFSEDTRSLALAVTGQGGVALAGSFDQPTEAAQGPDAAQSLVARLAPGGEMKWSRSFGPDGHQDRAEAIRIDANGGVWIAGTFQGEELVDGGFRVAGSGGDDVYVMKLTAGGQPLWIEAIGTAAEDRLLALEVGEEGNGYVVSDADPGEGFTLRRLRPNGGVAWTKQFPGAAPALGLYLDDQLYLAATFSAPEIKVGWETLSLKEGDSTGVWLARLDWDGDLVWVRSLDGDGRGGPRGIQDIAAMKDGDILLSGFGALPGFPDDRGDGRMFAARLSPAGTPERILRFGPPASSSAGVHVSLTPSSKDCIHVSGTFDGPFRWDGLRPRPDLDAGRFVGTLEADGSFGSVLVLPRTGPVRPMPASRDDAGNLYMVIGGPEDGVRVLTLEP
ncbi:MAG: hypothetical protein ABIK09_00870 [Pseudomonadota bacterium]